MISIDRSIVVLGGGVLGSSVALHLADLGIKVTLVDRPETGGDATRGSFAELTALDALNHDHYLLTSMGMSDWRRWGWRLGTDVGLRWDGSCRWTGDPEAAEHLRRITSAARDRGYPVREISAPELRELVGLHESVEVLYAIVADDDGRVDPALVVAGAKRALRSAGGEVLKGQARIRPQIGTVDIEVGEQSLHPDVVVMTAGAETHALVGGAGSDVPVRPDPGFMMVTDPVAPLSDQSLHFTTDEGWIAVRQDDRGRVLISRDWRLGQRNEPTNEYARHFLRRLARTLPVLSQATVASVSVRWKATPSDGLPITGPIPGLPSVYVALGHPGITLAPTIGRLVASEVHLGEPAPLLEPFRPSRFAERAMQTLLDVEELFEGKGRA
ncbi:MAG: FAD-dependent oxidoreductase [Actinobacteria bacterium]|nr:FAD-dependent oxidoreductase [Actinomycetota bacterium]